MQLTIIAFSLLCQLGQVDNTDYLRRFVLIDRHFAAPDDVGVSQVD